MLKITGNLNDNGFKTAAQLIAGATVENGNTVLRLSPTDDITLIAIGQPSSLVKSILVL
jgi:hypothetical protein